MNYFPHLIFLMSLSALSLFTLLLIRIMDFARIDPKRKIMLLKTNLVMIGFSPLIFYLLRLLSWQTLKIMQPVKFITQLPIDSVPTTFIESQTHWSFFIFVVYGVGLFIMFSRIFISYLIARKRLAGSLLTVIQGQPVFINEYIQSPLTFGFPKAMIYFPSNTKESWSTREIQISLAHEKIHLQQNDNLWKMLSLFVQALIFFVPWMHVLHRRFMLEMEIYCDEKTCAITNANAQEYGNLLIAMTCVQPINLIFTNITDSTLKRRLLAMKSITSKQPFLTTMVSTILILTGSTAIAMTSGITEKKAAYDITSKLFIDGKLISSPRIVTSGTASIAIGNKDGSQSLRMKLLAKNVPSSGSEDFIKVNYDIQIQDNGKKTHMVPQIIVAPNQEGRLSISSDSGHSYEMRVLATRE